MDRYGIVVIEPRFDSAGDFFGGLAIASRDGVSGYIDTFGNWRIRTHNGDFGNFENELALFIRLGNSSAHETAQRLIDHARQSVLSPQFDYLETFPEGRAAVAEVAPTAAVQNVIARVYRDSVAGKSGLIDTTGKIILLARYADIESHQTDTGSVGGLFKAWIGGKDYDFLRPDGSVAFQVDNAAVDRFSEGLARISRSGKFGFIDAAGTTVVAMTFEDAGNFSEGVAAAKKERWGFVDGAGEWVIPPQFEGAMEFRDGLAFVRLGLTWHYIDKQGRMIRPAAWTYPPCVLPDARLIELRPMLCGY